MQGLKEQERQPDWDAMAEKFSVWLPHLAAANEEIIRITDGILQRQPKSQLLDIASGVGEPALSLAQRYNQALVLASDLAEGMMKAAQHRVEIAQQDRLLLTVMSAQFMAITSNYFDLCTSRFGIMLLDNIEQGLSEIYRVLKIDGHLIATVWSHADHMPTLQWAYKAFFGQIPNNALPPLYRATCLGDAIVLRAALTQAGFDCLSIEEHKLCYRFDSFESYWHCIEQSGIMQPQFQYLSTNKHSGIKNKMAEMAESFMTEEGLVIPHRFSCIHAQKKLR